jgi:hypothetical protein
MHYIWNIESGIIGPTENSIKHLVYGTRWHGMNLDQLQIAANSYDLFKRACFNTTIFDEIVA